MVLNHASILAPESDRESIAEWLKDLTRGIARLVGDQVVQSSLRMAQGFHDTPCLPDYSLWAALHGLRAQGLLEEYLFLMRLAAKIPLLSEVEEEVGDRFLACEERTLTPPDGEPLVFCVITDGIAVGFPTAPEWDRDRVTVHFDELLPDEATEPASEEIDQLTRGAHAGPICARHRDRLLAGSDPHYVVGESRSGLPESFVRTGRAGRPSEVRVSAFHHRWKTDSARRVGSRVARPRRPGAEVEHEGDFREPSGDDQSGSPGSAQISIPSRYTGNLRMARSLW